MKKDFFILSAFCLMLCVIIFSAALFSEKYSRKVFSGKSSQTINKELANENLPVISAKDFFYDPELLFSSITKAKKTKSQENIFAIVSPHHFLAAEMIAEITKMASGRQVREVVIVGPNHENIGNEAMMTAKASWQTPFGTVAAEEKSVGRFLTDFEAADSPEVFENEHSIGTIVPFVKEYFPQAKIIPIVLNSFADQIKAEELSQWLAENVDKDCLVIFSMDFSHYLTKEEADRMDIITKQMIINKDIEKIARLGNDNVDCPAGLAAALLFAQKKQLTTEIVRNENSFDFSEEKSSSTTSYFTIRFVK